MAEVHPHPAHGEVHRHEPPSGFIRKYIFCVDHKVIGIQYYFLALFSVFIGMALSVLMRLQLGWPNEQFEFLKTLRFSGRHPTALYYYRELQALRDPLHFTSEETPA